MLVNPNIGSSVGNRSGFSGFISNLCKNLVRKRKSSILARDSPKHDLFPMKINQPEIFQHLIFYTYQSEKENISVTEQIVI